MTRRIRTLRNVAIPLIVVLGIGAAFSLLSNDNKETAIKHHYVDRDDVLRRMLPRFAGSGEK